LFGKIKKRTLPKPKANLFVGLGCRPRRRGALANGSAVRCSGPARLRCACFGRAGAQTPPLHWLCFGRPIEPPFGRFRVGRQAFEPLDGAELRPSRSDRRHEEGSPLRAPDERVWMASASASRFSWRVWHAKSKGRKPLRRSVFAAPVRRAPPFKFGAMGAAAAAGLATLPERFGDCLTAAAPGRSAALFSASPGFFLSAYL
jgi:hypothetical protein